MPIYDIFDNEISHHNDFPNNGNIVNIEFGAGRNYFGKKEYPKCYLTDLITPDLIHFTQSADYNEVDNHFLDDVCNFFDYNFERTFDKIIMCNPFNYGFNGLGNAKKFFDRAGKLLNDNGEIHIVGSSLNPWCSKDSFDEFFYNEIDLYKTDYNFILHSHEELSRENRINTSYRFYKTELKDITIPNQKIVIKKLENE
ncbi:class I SAM-dependent methyltransferase [Flavobacterium sp.]|uniref:class I SAM-dependent methyltransferase n=1 Tax=Flavobacterium sp. TaxID=239 RepID=UPI003F695557